MKKIIYSVVAVLSLSNLALPSTAVAQVKYPERTVTIVVPFAAGGPTDTSARIIADGLSKNMSSTFIVENHPGAGSSIGTSSVAKKDPDGYTLLWGSGSGLTTFPNLKETDYDPINSFVPISLVVETPYVLATQPTLGVETVEQLVSAIKQNPDGYNYGSTGIGGTAHLISELFNKQANIESVHIPYGGGAPMIQALLAGDVQYVFDTPITLEPIVEAGKAKALAVTSLERWNSMPEATPLAEYQDGFEGFNVTAWFGLLAPKGTPKEIVNHLSDEIQRVVQEPEVKRALENVGFFVVGSSSDQFAQTIEQYNDLWADLIEETNITIE